MDPLLGLLQGLKTAGTLNNLLYCFVGCFFGTLTGVLPGFGPAAAVAMLLPSTLTLPAASAVIMLAGVYYGAMYGGSTTSILVNVPGEAASVVTCLDGYQMALQGRAGAALGIAAFASFIAGTIGVLGLMLVAPPLAELALKFTSVEYVAVVILGLTLLCFLGSGSKIKAFMMAAFGVLLGLVGSDPSLSTERFTFGLDFLIDGVGLVPVIVGLFGISEVLKNLESQEFSPLVEKGKIKNLLPTKQDWKDAIGSILRGSLIGFFYGLLPGGGATVSSVVAYTLEKRFSRRPQEFGHGVIEGVAAPEAANNGAATSAFIPLLTLGIPTTGVMAIVLAALMLHNVTPGPLLIKNNPGVFWGVIASMYIGNGLLLVINLPLIGIWVRVLKIPYSFLFTSIILFCLIGAVAVKNAVPDIGITAFFGVIGFLMKKFKYEPAPLLFAFILGPLLEDNFRRALTISGGDFSVFFNRPLAVFFFSLAMAIGIVPLVLKRMRRPENHPG
jgi:putative tricarboxylic transport membrane protein